MKTPTKIDPSPLAEAVVDVRFVPSVPPPAVFGYVYGLIKDRYRTPLVFRSLIYRRISVHGNQASFFNLITA
ncbi:MAG: hypothetical protein AB1646_08110 [Thermodesulfobacteriota bacterium]